MPRIVASCRAARLRRLVLVATVLMATALLTLPGLPPGAPGVANAAPALQACRIAAVGTFAPAASSLDLGCPTSAGFPSPTSVQAFERGSMLWLAEWGTITVFKEDGSYESLDDLYDPQEPPPAALTTPAPAGLLEPLQGFGEIWRKLGGPTAPLGWASGPEQAYVATVQYFERGVVIQSADGGWIGLATFNHAHGRWAAMRSQ